jgi:hypothetical protein
MSTELSATSPLAAGLQAISEAVAGGEEKDHVIAAKCRALLRGYDARWRDDTEWEPWSVETYVETPLMNPASGRRSRRFRLGGKLDTIGILPNGGRVIVDHKTTVSDIEDITSSYWQQLSIDSQVNQYHLLEWISGRKADVAVWDVVRKPTINPARIVKVELALLCAMETKGAPRTHIKPGEWYGLELTHDELEAARESGRESPAMYEARLGWDIRERPGRYFQRRNLPRLDADLLAHAEDLWTHADDIARARRTGRWPKSSGNCNDYRRMCQYLPLCAGTDNTDSDKWLFNDKVHAELDIDHDGLDLLTNSRIKTWQACPKKHYWKYEMGLSRADRERSEALHFGSVWHAGQEAYFQYTINKRRTVNASLTK